MTKNLLRQKSPLSEKLKNLLAQKIKSNLPSRAKENLSGSFISGSGRTYGKIIDDYRGSNGFGYDPIFLSDELGKTFGEATMEEKNKISCGQSREFGYCVCFYVSVFFESTSVFFDFHVYVQIGERVDILEFMNIYSARYAGEPCNDKNNNTKLLSKLHALENNKDKVDRTA